ncbi:hypothetical protein PpBr36_01323 [Pyricularia pennisetigena]|uniref:hypothetical protein n=1 Tax=Pyricularia pennisetigena TaxID=1578925 RepID=UPI001150E4B6|nr:hypothetical protein PpBr36_01323 [Pyricularia pennisetigena]TLS29286.1 hypothetical protein PpBr36_01323 [Pyricularia pennisetigena]
MSPRAIPGDFSHRTATLGLRTSGVMRNTRPDGSQGGDQPLSDGRYGPRGPAALRLWSGSRRRSYDDQSIVSKRPKALDNPFLARTIFERSSG